MKRRPPVIPILLLLVAVVAGAIVNVAVAWGCAIAFGSERDIRSRFVAPPWNQHLPWQALSNDEQSLLKRAGWELPTKAAGGTIWAARSDRKRFGFSEIAYHPYVDMRGLMRQSADGWRRENAYLPTANATIVAVSVGWPAKAFEELQFHRPQRIAQTQQPSVEHVAAIPMPTMAGAFPESNGYFLPFDALWPGFAINTVFYAAVLWGLFAAPFALRRRRRIKRGLCPKCAYPVGTSDKCTECGAAVV